MQDSSKPSKLLYFVIIVAFFLAIFVGLTYKRYQTKSIVQQGPVQTQPWQQTQPQLQAQPPAPQAPTTQTPLPDDDKDLQDIDNVLDSINDDINLNDF